MNVAVIIPALDEEPSIASVIRGLDHPSIRQVIVGDNGSRDRTAEIALREGAEVVAVEERGYGAACAGALEMVRPEIDTVLFVDGDGSDDLSEMNRLLEPIARGEADLVIGSRALGDVEPGALTPQQRFGNWLATRLIRLFFGHHYTDLGPFRAIRRDTLAIIGMQDRRYGWTVEMQIRALQIGAKVVEVPVSYRKRIGKSKISGTVTGVIKAGWWILWTIAKYGLRSAGKR
ncbi:MAG: glycosyltransferase family 2 protein [Thermoanaerobaculia bacterium]|nr:glycosyltransferase family 2 protein [Thermoanaerobaculia bacterium]